MSLPPNTLWYNGDWNLFVGISDVTDAQCPCIPVGSETVVTDETCVSRPPNQLSEEILLATYSDFDVLDPFGWTVTGVFSDNFTILPLSVLTTFTATYEIREGITPGNGGTLITSGIAPVTVTATGRSVVSGGDTYTEYRFLITGLNIPLSPNKYWVNVAPIIPESVVTTYGSTFLLFNSTTDGANAVGVPPGNNANDYFVVGDPIPTVYFIPSTQFGQEYHDFSNGVTGFVNPICIHPDMKAILQDGSIAMVRDLQVGTLLRTLDADRPAKLLINYKNEIPHHVLIKILPDALERGVPDEILFVTSNHKIMVDGRLRKPRELINGITISRSRGGGPVHTHTLVTDTGDPVMINGTPVATWAIKDWKR
jgi:hypothetical protein